MRTIQVYCLNTALKLYSSVVVVPVFYGTYTALGLVNTIIYLDEIGNYPPWAIILVFGGIGVLIYGVFLLSSKPDPAASLNDEDEDINHNHDQELVQFNWLTSKEEKEVVAARQYDNDASAAKISTGESSTSHQPVEADVIKHPNQYGPLSKLFKRLKYFGYQHHPDPSRREAETFISLQSTSSDHVMPLDAHNNNCPKPPPNSYLP